MSSVPKPPLPRAPIQKAPAAIVTPTAVRMGKIKRGGGHRVVLYGTGGIQKTTLAAYAPAPVAFIDLDQSLPRLHDRFAELGIIDRVSVVEGVTDWATMRAGLNGPDLSAAKTIVIDTGTRAEELCVAHILATVRGEGGSIANRIEDYGYGKGYQHVFEAWCQLLGDLDRIAQRGQHVVIVCHDCSAAFANPMGGDFLRFEPRLQTSATGKASIRMRTKEWADHVIWIGYDVEAGKDKKGKGSGTATMYFAERPWAMAKSRTMVDEMPLERAFEEFWPLLTGDTSDSD